MTSAIITIFKKSTRHFLERVLKQNGMFTVADLGKIFTGANLHIKFNLMAKEANSMFVRVLLCFMFL